MSVKIFRNGAWEEKGGSSDAVLYERLKLRRCEIDFTDLFEISPFAESKPTIKSGYLYTNYITHLCGSFECLIPKLEVTDGRCYHLLSMNTTKYAEVFSPSYWPDFGFARIESASLPGIQVNYFDIRAEWRYGIRLYTQKIYENLTIEINFSVLIENPHLNYF